MSENVPENLAKQRASFEKAQFQGDESFVVSESLSLKESTRLAGTRSKNSERICFYRFLDVFLSRSVTATSDAIPS